MRLVMSLNVNGVGLAPARVISPPPVPATELTARDVATAARVGVQAVPVRNNDPVTGTAKREKRGDTNDEKRAAEDAERDRVDLDTGPLGGTRRAAHLVLDDRHPTLPSAPASPGRANAPAAGF